jgi:hypothetical protein
MIVSANINYKDLRYRKINYLARLRKERKVLLIIRLLRSLARNSGLTKKAMTILKWRALQGDTKSIPSPSKKKCWEQVLIH